MMHFVRASELASQHFNCYMCDASCHFNANMYALIKILCNFLVYDRYRLAHEYGNSIEFTELWDRLQMDGRCCGVTGPQVSEL